MGKGDGDWDVDDEEDGGFAWNWHTIVVASFTLLWYAFIFIVATAWTCAASWTGCVGGWEDGPVAVGPWEEPSGPEGTNYNLDYSLWDTSPKYAPQMQGAEYYTNGFNLKLIDFTTWKTSDYNNEKIGTTSGGLEEYNPDYLSNRCGNYCRGYWRKKTVTVTKTCATASNAGGIPVFTSGQCQGTVEILVPMASSWKGTDYLATAIILTVYLCMEFLNVFTKFFRGILEVDLTIFKDAIGEQGRTARRYLIYVTLYVCLLNWFAYNDSDRGVPREMPEGMTRDNYNNMEYVSGQFINRWFGLRWANFAFFCCLFVYQLRLVIGYRVRLGMKLAATVMYPLTSLTILIYTICAIYT